jgi:hypothetical protein
VQIVTHQSCMASMATRTVLSVSERGEPTSREAANDKNNAATDSAAAYVSECDFCRRRQAREPGRCPTCSWSGTSWTYVTRDCVDAIRPRNDTCCLPCPNSVNRPPSLS